jgi:glucokinase
LVKLTASSGLCYRERSTDPNCEGLMTTEHTGGDGPLYIGVDLGGTTVRAGLVDASGALLRELSLDTESERADDLFRQLTTLVRELDADPEAAGRVAAVGVGLPGLVNSETHQAVMLPNLPDLSTVDLYGELRKLTGRPVVLDNDSNAAAYGEYVCGAGRGARNLFYVGIGTGIGAGLVFGGRVWRGSNGYAGEFGHMTIDPDGIECACGNVGCLETVCSAPNIVRRARERLFRDRTSSLSRLVIPRDREFTSLDIANAAAAGDDMAQLIMDRTGMYLGVALAGVINLLNVDAVVLGGDVVAAGEALLGPLVDHTRRRAFAPTFQACRITAARLGNSSGVVGAALLARDEA